MNDRPTLHVFKPDAPDSAGIISWVHVGDLHMRAAGDQNDLDLQAIVKEVNLHFAGAISFVFFPGDNADHGDVAGYSVVRNALDQLKVPWCAIIGDHDVEQKSFDNFRTFMNQESHYAFDLGDVRFVALNAFDFPDPTSFTIGDGQLHWLEEQLQAATRAGQTKVLFMHCYPSDLKKGRDEVEQLVSHYGVKLIDMGHTHYNEIAHDGKTIYTATRSTGQIEEGPVGFSVTNLDHGVVSWRFLELGELPAVIITTPADERLVADDAETDSSHQKLLTVHAKVWSRTQILKVKASLGRETVWMQPIPGTKVWEAELPSGSLEPGIHPLQVEAVDSDGKAARDEVQALIGASRPSRQRQERDQDNALEAWPEHGILGTQLGPNKNGRKW